MKNKKLNVCNLLMFIFLVFALTFDLVTKYVVDSQLTYHQEVDFIPGFLSFCLDYNEGAAWGIFSNLQWLLIIITFVFLVIYLWFFFAKKSRSNLLGIASGLLLGGCLGNLYDRLFIGGPFFAGHVRDFLKFQFMNFPIFNIADTCLCIGVFLLAIYFIFIYPREIKKEKTQEQTNTNIQSEEIYIEDIAKKKPKFTFKDLFKKQDRQKYQKKSQIEDEDNNE